ncbi:unnamed protein product [Closterium sp. NIES-53]
MPSQKCDEPEAEEEEEIPDGVEVRLKDMAGLIAKLTTQVNLYEVTVDALHASVDKLQQTLADRDVAIYQLQHDMAALKQLCFPRAGFAGGSPEKVASSPAPPAVGARRIAVQAQPPTHPDGGKPPDAVAGVEHVTAPGSTQQCVAHGAVATCVQGPELRTHRPGISTAGPGAMVRVAKFGEGESKRTALTGGRARTSKWTGVRLDAATGKWHETIGLQKGRS